MVLKYERANFTCAEIFLFSTVVTAICCVFCIFLLGISIRYLWPRSIFGRATKSMSYSQVPQVVIPSTMTHSSLPIGVGIGVAATAATAIATTTTTTTTAITITASPPEESSGDQINKTIKWLATAYIISSIVFTAVALIEQLLYVVMKSVDACPGNFYYLVIASYVRVFLYLFYTIRVDVVFRKSVFEISIGMRRFMIYVPTTIYLTVATSRIIYGRFLPCGDTDYILRMMPIVFALVDVAWTVSLFVFFIYKLRQLIDAEEICNTTRKDLRGLMKKLFRLYVFTQVTTLLASITSLIEPLTEFRHIAIAVDAVMHSAAMLLSFKFARSQYYFWCLCRTEKSFNLDN